MRRVNSAAQAYRESDFDLLEMKLMWIKAANRNGTGRQGYGFWNGVDPVNVTVRDAFTGNDVFRSFYPAGLVVDNARFESGLSYRPTRISVSSAAQISRLCFREDDASNAETQVWRWNWDPDTKRPKNNPELWLVGEIDESNISKPSIDGGSAGSLEFDIVGLTRRLAVASNRKSSHNQQKKRNGDMIGQYIVDTGTWDVAWGQEER